MGNEERELPNIIICGTPGTGKTTLAEQVAETTELENICIGDVVKENHLHFGFDEKWKTYDVDEDKVLDYLEPKLLKGGCIIDWHTCGLFSEELIDLVVVLRTDHSKLWERLESRGYSLEKIQENNEAEIMQICLEEARESFDPKIVVELPSESIEEMESNLSRITQWVTNWKKNH
ncbi:RNA mimic/ribosome assembly chaperone for Rps14 [Schizosaccharomyces pombe]|uniref:Adenylate kinase isoenzyme 6 homolog n=1 Tax=Schizosaccharomyces pombe (strain 972 / ATCC 24843) TaxID=284812 RepID=KAD6_SCHPO|nr:putative nucleoside-triphosphatase [Schizosaccharomyces pombe]Q9UU88.1 RecName: Full=Adenylate kinase isoenzyme 6 homolog; Short=AK6; AltName: Full=Dual activity adenylate kinase/ATPase; Short=AK/ATPase [Schizosaccharomyces pombe 972h-]CAB52884.1 nucleoside-triphosphatase involved in SSU-rRNA maturation (predicted) [Schizosaccharomyces pombe]|eukprot:NP_588481.1 putative nucleoside-triphosphatase [Schizosaccharomyces pombe]